MMDCFALILGHQMRCIKLIGLLFVFHSFFVFADDDAYLKDFLRFMEKSGSNQTQKTVLQKMFQQFQSMGDGSVNFSAMEKMMNEEIENLNREMFVIYKKHLSHKDMKEILKFYDSPIGKKLVEAQPKITIEAMGIGMKWGQSVAQRVMQSIQNTKRKEK